VGLRRLTRVDLFSKSLGEQISLTTTSLRLSFESEEPELIWVMFMLWTVMFVIENGCEGSVYFFSFFSFSISSDYDRESITVFSISSPLFRMFACALFFFRSCAKSVLVGVSASLSASKKLS
jgi:hypothetical protein